MVKLSTEARTNDICRGLFLFRDRLRALNLWYAKEPLAENVQEAWDNIREEPAAETVVSAVADLDTAVYGKHAVPVSAAGMLRRDAAGLGKARGKCF